MTTHTYFNSDEALATLAGVGTEYLVCYHDGIGQFMAGLANRGPQFEGSWLECIQWAANRTAREVEMEEGAGESTPEGDRLAIVTPEGDVR